MAPTLFSPPSTHLPTISATFSSKTHFTHKSHLQLLPNKRSNFFILSTKATENGGAGVVGSSATTTSVVEEKKVEVSGTEKKVEEKEVSIESNGATPPAAAAAAAAAVATEVEEAPKFKDPRWVAGTWDLKQFKKDGKTNWDSVIDAEVRRRKWLEDNPETSSNDDPVVFDTSIIPWWSWVKRFHLPEAEKLNGRAAMIGFFMAYFVDSLTGVGLVDQMGNFFCKTLLLVAVSGVLLVRKNEDVDNLKKLFDETTFYDKQWQATWQDDKTSGSKKDK